MKKHLIFLIFACLACGQIEDKNLDPNEVVFTTNDASKLFFKNTRQSQYILEELEEAKLEIYRWQKPLNDEVPQIHLALINNWRYDEAYLLLEPNDLIPDLNNLKVKWANPENGESGEISFTGGNKTYHAQFAGFVYLKLREKCVFEISIMGNGSLFSKTQQAVKPLRQRFTTIIG